MFLAYFALGAAWGLLCYKHREDLLPIQVSTCTGCAMSVLLKKIQYYITGLVAFLIIEMVASWGKKVLS